MSEEMSPGADTVGRMFDLGRAQPQSDGAETMAGSVIEIPVDQIEPDPDNPRKTIDQKELEGLAQSIASSGLKQPITVRPNASKPGHYIINFGERRWRACKLIDKPTILAIVSTHDGVRVGQIIENLQRAEVRPIEEAIGIAKLVNEERADKGEIAKRLGVQAAHISMCLKIAGMGDDTLLELSKRDLGIRPMYMLAQAPLDLRIKLLKKPDAELTRAKIEEAIRKASGRGRSSKDEPPSGRTGKRGKSTPSLDDLLVNTKDALAAVDRDEIHDDLRARLAELRAQIDDFLGSETCAREAAE